MRYAMLVLLPLALAGCGMERAVLVNDRGERITCETRAYGLIPNLVASSQQKECVAEAESRGYRLEP